MDPGFASQLNGTCSSDPNAFAFLDPSPVGFDNALYRNLQVGKGLLAPTRRRWSRSGRWRVGQADDLGRRWHDRPLQVAGSAVARPTTAVERGGRGMPGAPRGESGSTGAGGTVAAAEADGGGWQGGARPRRGEGAAQEQEPVRGSGRDGGGGEARDGLGATTVALGVLGARARAAGGGGGGGRGRRRWRRTSARLCPGERGRGREEERREA
ncbi:uncharacterized protein [Miscanthus floridulus]|uniref:uncharacterized protein n=1 Tax=Miscanthus floridulus TaxID=154761 RepID=UPI00345817A5